MSANKKVDPLFDLKNTILELIGDLRNLFTDSEEQGDLTLVEFFFNRKHPEDIMHHCIQHILPRESKIRRRDQDFFITNRAIFSGIPEDRIDHYVNFVANADIHPDDRELIWTYFDTIIELVRKYKKME